MIELLKNQEDCCGCRTCEKVCPKGAIQMKPDKCVYGNENRVADITLADFWGYEDVIPGIWEDNKENIFEKLLKCNS